MELQLFNDLIEWPGIANLKPKEVYFSRNTVNTGNLKLTTKAMVGTMKETAESLGVDPNRISAKSLRKALGTDMTRSNVPNETMNKLGRWANNSKVARHHNICSGNGWKLNRNNVRRNHQDFLTRLTKNE